MDTYFSSTELAYYARQMNLSEIGMTGQYKLKQARVGCVGAGGLGSAVMMYLAAAGVGTIGIIDDDCVDISNLHRQLLYTYADSGCKKTLVAKARLQQLNPAIEIITHDVRLNTANALAILNQYDLIVDGSDNFTTRYVVNDACFSLNKAHIYASISQFAGQCATFVPKKGPCFRCLFAIPPPIDLIPNCAQGGVIGALPGILGTLQAMEVIKLILSIGQPLIGRLLLFDGLSLQFRELTISPNPECKVCRYEQLFSDLSYADKPVCAVDSPEISVYELQRLKQENIDFLLLDVREPMEYEIGNLQGGQLIPLNHLPHRLAELDRKKFTIVYCQSGQRSKRAVELLIQHDFVNVRSLQGGMKAWIEQIDPLMEKY
ncbi:MAG: hypothetical protein A3F11_06100 [Gammaproteobacteria bacterium RIFCSPHIGHO2_12_FULL_37_14]|nr:MAG: hypothetical protein A3F11_06100 [Gammaproteobacteria bacterium RIFCSPHIGHO2_12_FULL_37_14]